MNTHSLLQQVSLITRKYDDISKITGERYNVFAVLGKQRDELTHSRIIGDLLNINGRHQMGGRFFELFLEVILKKYNEKENPVIRKIIAFGKEAYKKHIEKTIDYIDSSEENGRIDILLTDNKQNTIIIENKIDAGDGIKQLARYHKAYKKAAILYLTIDGKQPNSDSTKGEIDKEFIELVGDEHFICISYSSDITTWLELCIKESVSFPLLRETLKQYLYLIKNITGQSTNKDMENEIINTVMSSSNNIEAALALAKNVDKLKVVLINTFIERFKEQINGEDINAKSEDKDVVTHIYNSKCKPGDKDYYFGVRLGKIKNADIDIRIQFTQPFGNIRVSLYSSNRDVDFMEILNKNYRPSIKGIISGKEIQVGSMLLGFGIFWSNEYDLLTDFFNNDKKLSTLAHHNNSDEIIKQVVAQVIEIRNKIFATTPQ